MRVDDLKNKGKNTRQKELDKRKKMLVMVISTFLIATIVLIGWIVIFKSTDKINIYEDNNMKFEYDSSWSISRNSNDTISLTHKTNSFVDLKVSKITSNNYNSGISSISDEIKYDIEKQDSKYKLLKEEEKKIGKKGYDSYKMLYENEDSQSLVIVLRNQERLYVINYTAKNEYFDILLDSFQTILGSLELK